MMTTVPAPNVTPGESFSHGAPPPSDAIVLFDGTDSQMGQLKGWEACGLKIENATEVVPKSGTIQTKDHLETCYT